MIFIKERKFIPSKPINQIELQFLFKPATSADFVNSGPGYWPVLSPGTASIGYTGSKIDGTNNRSGIEDIFFGVHLNGSPFGLYQLQKEPGRSARCR